MPKKNPRSNVLPSLAFLVLHGLIADRSHAEVTLDGSLGQSGSLAGPEYVIRADMGQQVDTNLFHSFGIFNINMDESATFTGEGSIGSIENVLGRVTGGSLSNIDGMLRSTIPGADLFLINPAGIMFGPNAQFDVQGSFHASTADFIRLEDGVRFNAMPSAEDALLTTASPTAFGFLEANPTEITVQESQLGVPDGETLSVVGGHIQITGGNLSAPNGRINVASAASQGEVVLSKDLNVDSLDQLGTITASSATSINIIGGGGEGVSVRSGVFTMEGGSQINSGTQPFSTDKGADISIEVDELTLTAGSRIDNFADASSTGSGGNIEVRSTESITVSDSSFIRSLTMGDGNGGEITIETGSLELTSGGAVFSSSGFSDQTTGDVIAGQGEAGNIAINTTGPVTISDPDNLGPFSRTGIFGQTLGDGNAGRVSLSSPNSALRIDRGAIQSITLNDGNAGDLALEAGNLELTNGAGIFSRSGFQDPKTGVVTAGTGKAGNIMAGIKDLITISSGSQVSNTTIGGDAGKISMSTPDTLRMDSGFILAGTLRDGNAGDIVVDVNDLILANGSAIDSSTRGSVQAGNVNVIANNDISMSGRRNDGFGSGIFSNSGGGDGNAGKVVVSARNLNMTGGLIQATSSNEGGSAGDIMIVVGSLSLKDGARIDVRTDSEGNGGSATVTVTDSISISGDDEGNRSGLFANTIGTVGGAGQLFVSASRLEIGEGGVIQAGSTGINSLGNAGKITVEVDSLHLSDGGGIVSNTLSSGQGGEINITSSKRIIIAGRNSDGLGSSIATISGFGAGQAGSLTIYTPILEIGDGGIILAGTLASGRGGDIVINSEHVALIGDAAIDTSTFGKGDGGNVQIDADTVSIMGEESQISSSTVTVGRGGDVRINARVVKLEEGGVISADSTSEEPGAGESGKVTIVASDTLSLFDRAQISVKTERADAGDVDINAGNLVHLRNQSSITTSVAEEKGNGGNITIDPVFVILDGASEIVSKAKEGSGGNINIRIVGGGAIFKSPDSVIDASSEFGIDGAVEIDAPDTDISGSIGALPAAFLNVASLLSERCAARTAETVSSFVVVGRGGVPPSPESASLGSYVDRNVASERGDRHSDSHHYPQIAKNHQITNQGALAVVELECPQ